MSVPAVPDPPDVDVLVHRLRSELGVVVEPSDLALSWRDWRWMAVLPEVVVLIAASDDGWKRLGREAVLIVAARDVVGPQIPRVLVQDQEFRIQVRDSMSGLHGHGIEARIFGIGDRPSMEPTPRFAQDCPLTPWGERFADDLGRTFARFHRAMSAAQARAAGFVRSRMNWDEVERVLHERPGVEHLLRAVPAARAWDESRAIEEVVIHGDPHLYNIFASERGRVSGLIDFGDAAVGDRHEDLRYLHSEGPRFARISISAYEDESGGAVEPEIVARHHVRSALGHFAYWDSMGEQGREREIIEWTTAAQETLAPEWLR